MNIALPILLLAFGGLSLWILTESNIRWYIKTACIATFCLFTVIFWTTIHSFLGWSANEEDMPEKVLIHWVIIKEPNKLTKSDGSIHILLESMEEAKGNTVSKFFGYRNDKVEPRLFKLKYNRKLHEKLQGLKKRLARGQPIAGKFTRKGDGGEGEPGKGKAYHKDGGGSESQEQDWEFHELLPSEIHKKPER